MGGQNEEDLEPHPDQLWIELPTSRRFTRQKLHYHMPRQDGWLLRKYTDTPRAIWTLMNERWSSFLSWIYFVIAEQCSDSPSNFSSQIRPGYSLMNICFYREVVSSDLRSLNGCWDNPKRIFEMTLVYGIWLTTERGKNNYMPTTDWRRAALAPREKFNRKHRSTRRLIECFFGFLIQRFSLPQHHPSPFGISTCWRWGVQNVLSLAELDCFRLQHRRLRLVRRECAVWKFKNIFTSSHFFRFSIMFWLFILNVWLLGHLKTHVQ